MARIDDQKSLNKIGPVARAAAKAAELKQADDTTKTAEPAIKLPTDVLSGIGKRVEKVVPAVAPAKKSFFGGLWDGLKQKASSAWNWIKDTGSKIGTGLGNGMMKLIFGASSEQFKTRDVYDDPSDVNHPTDQEVADAKATIDANKNKVDAALAKLSPDQRKQYDAVSALTVGRPTCQLALQTMLLDGRLTTGKDLKGQGSVLDHLAKLGTQDLAKDVDRRKLVSEVIGELENPVRIDQHGVGTCGATTAQILLIRQNPAEYVRLMEGLASPAGKAQMSGGDTITRVEDWNDNSDGNPDWGDDRTTSSRLFQPAVMSYGEPLPGERYDNSEDRGKLGPIPLMGGLYSLTKICTQLTGKAYDGNTVFFWNHDSQWSKIKDALKANKGPIPVAVRWNSDGEAGGHFIQIDKIENGKVYITNPWGQRESFSEQELKDHLTASYIPKD